MPKAVISDTSCFIILFKINALNLLQKLYGSVITTQEVAEEFGHRLPDWVEIRASKDTYRIQILETQIDRGEASAIALALDISDCLIILDDIKARNIAQKLGLEITGTLGVMIKAKLKGIIPSINPYLAEITKTNFRLSEHIIREALLEAGELN